ncbi:MAG: hypothetical protein HRT87_12600 [Legionellales bacterium]|nr:hypothetical protein [Legionellales bacterium]
MKTIRNLIDRNWDLVEDGELDGDLIPCLQDCEDEFSDATNKLNKLLIPNVVCSAYLVNVDYGQIIVMAENISKAFDKLEQAGYKGYSLAKNVGLDVL